MSFHHWLSVDPHFELCPFFLGCVPSFWGMPPYLLPNRHHSHHPFGPCLDEGKNTVMLIYSPSSDKKASSYKMYLPSQAHWASPLPQCMEKSLDFEGAVVAQAHPFTAQPFPEGKPEGEGVALRHCCCVRSQAGGCHVLPPASPHELGQGHPFPPIPSLDKVKANLKDFSRLSSAIFPVYLLCLTGASSRDRDLTGCFEDEF